MTSRGSSSPVVVAIDAGTTGVRSIAVDDAGTIVDASYREFTQHFPRPGWVEHDAEEIWAATQTTLGELCGRLDRPIAAIGITDQRETVVAWSRSSGLPRHRAIVWQDRRTAERCDELAAHLPRVRALTGLVLDPYFSGSKLEWLFRHGGVERDADLALGTIDSWLIWKLTGGAAHVTDPSNASRTMLLDITTGRWSDELCDLFGVPPTALPDVRPSSGRVVRIPPRDVITRGSTHHLEQHGPPILRALAYIEEHAVTGIAVAAVMKATQTMSLASSPS